VEPAPRPDDRSCGELPALRCDCFEAGGFRLPVDIDHYQPAARGEPDVGIGPSGPPGCHLIRIGGGVLLPRLDSRVLAGRAAVSAAAAGTADADVDREHPPAAPGVL